ncbi:hypothetical protein J6T21_00490 [Candidatus Saccharibacteria bacterium]|nr:hypothetical protein [Candidatus Saccharibacteria bacterium]
MNNHEALNNNGQNWDMSDVQFTGAKKQQSVDSLQKALRNAPELLLESEIFGGNGKRSKFTDSVLFGQSNTGILESIKELDNGRYKINYGTDYSNKGFTGLGQVSGALDFFDEKYGDYIDNRELKGLIKTCIAMWPMGNVGSFGVHQFAKSAKMDEKTASLVNMIINRNSMRLVEEYFDKGIQESGVKLREINENYLIRLHDGLESGYEEKEARCACNIQKIIMDCEKAGATIAKERKAL